LARILGLLSRLRLVTGVLLFVFVCGHYGNHALGLISLDAMEAGRRVFLAVWRSPPGQGLLYSSLGLHAVLALFALLRRRTLRRISRLDIVQGIFGLAIMPLLILHMIGTRGLNAAYGFNDLYAYMVLSLWHDSPWDGVQQSIALLVVWVHGVIGLHQWLRLQPWYERAFLPLFALAVLVPVLALLGFAAGAREAVRLLEDPAWVAEYRRTVVLTPEMAAWGYRLYANFINGMMVLAVALVAIRALLWIVEQRRVRIAIVYPNGQTVSVRPGSVSVLEASRIAGIPHAAVCGGRGRCSTCRVRVTRGVDELAQPGENERRVLKRVAAPPGVRLACQVRPVADIAVMPMLPAGANVRDGSARPDFVHGSEREIAILFADLRAFTKFSETKLPYDVVFIINQFSRQMGQAVEQSGGRIDKFIGDGVMALFGIESGAEEGSRQALVAAKAMAANLGDMNASLAHDMDEPLRMGIGIHCGPAIVGEMGYANAVTVTAIGDAVNTASRLEAATKDYNVQLVVSRDLADRAGVDLGAFMGDQIEVRGRTGKLDIVVVRRAADLPV